ncbi:hypothetical protein BD309DRAFT_160518 [Dichomitus squalens]|uniref:Uncharacterized protein n=1 Tax=Dichomitus squalens TaxID=114155 RepID=A0A4Q9P3T0_9APHY|nr:hypothetical protein BD309DRAFT_160518 [Dichomitus squalens]TBU64132.1 hypothetical protein BD310DRAFT_468848 [Dichomitus squalens]
MRCDHSPYIPQAARSGATRQGVPLVVGICLTPGTPHRDTAHSEMFPKVLAAMTTQCTEDEWADGVYRIACPTTAFALIYGRWARVHHSG